MARTLYDLIRSVSTNVGDLDEGSLTGATSTTSLADTTRTDPTGWETGANLSLVASPASLLNNGQERKVTAYATGVFTTFAFPAVPSTGDKYELRRYPLHTRQAIKEFINQAIREVQRLTWASVDSRTDLADKTAYEINTLEYTVPTSMEMVHSVLYLDITNAPTVTTATLPVTGSATTDYYYISDTQQVVQWSGSAWVASTRIPWVELRYDWWTSNVTGTILIQEQQQYTWGQDSDNCPPIPDGAPLRFKGSRRPVELVNETDVTEIEGNYVEVFATARMCLRLARGNQDQADFNSKFQMFYKLEADAFRGTRRGLPSGSRKVR